MTRSVSGSGRSREKESFHLDEADLLHEYVEKMQGMTDRMLYVFYFEHKKLDELSYKRFSLETFTGNTIDDAAEHFTRILLGMQTAGRNLLIDRIRKGEQYIESLERTHPHYQAAENKLVRLIHELATYNQ